MTKLVLSSACLAANDALLSSACLAANDTLLSSACLAAKCRVKHRRGLCHAGGEKSNGLNTCCYL